MAGMRLFGEIAKKCGAELLALGNVDRAHDVGQAALFEHDRNLPAVRRRPVIELDRRLLRGAAAPAPSAGGFGLVSFGLARFDLGIVAWRFRSI